MHFSMLFGTASAGVATKTVSVDIDPMAAHPPNDIKRVEYASAIARVAPPALPTEGLAAAISSGRQQAVFADLVGKIAAHSLARTAATMHSALAAYSTLSEVEGEELVDQVIDGQAQRVWNLTKWVLQGFKPRLTPELLSALGPVIDAMTAHDPSSANGLSPNASATLALAKRALAAQIRDDIKAGRLDERRIAALIGEGPGAAVVGQAILPLAFRV
jgi:hypothetical protein